MKKIILLLCCTIAPVAVKAMDASQSPLHIAAGSGRLEQVEQQLLQQGAVIDSQDSDGRTPLYLAVQAGHAEIIRFLLNHNARTNIPHNDGSTVLEMAAVTCDLDTIANILTHSAKTNVLAAGLTTLQWTYCYASNPHLDEPGRERASQIIGLILQHMKDNNDICPICLQNAEQFPIEQQTATPCCNQFICAADKRAIIASTHVCPFCRAHAGW